MNDLHQRGVLGRLGALDPARSHSGAAASADDEMLHQIMRTPQGAVDAELLPNPGRRGPLLAASVVAALAIAAGVVVWADSTEPAYASWTARPMEVSPASERLAREQCPDTVVHIDDDGQMGTVAVEPVLFDVRGEYTYVLSSDGDETFAECFVFTDDSGPVVLTLESAGVDGIDAPAHGASVVDAGTAPWSLAAEQLSQPLSASFGRVSDDVERVILETTAGEEVHATIQNGWWAAWAPGDETFADSITLISGDGATTHQELLEGNS